MAYKNLHEFVKKLDENGELHRINVFADPELEITEITDRVSKMPFGGKALLFENTGTDFPVLINSMGSDKRICMALGVKRLNELQNEVEEIFRMLTKPGGDIWSKLKMLPQLGKIASWMPKKKSGKGKCQEVIMKTPDIFKLPVLKCWPADGGRFITLPMVNTIDKESGIRNVGMYRMQLYSSTETGMHWHRHKTGARHFEQYLEAGEKMPVTVTLGGDLAYTYAATAPLPDNIDEYMLAGFLRKKHVDLVKCLTNDIYVPSDVDFVIEGYVDPEEDFRLEGPFGDHTGFYSLPDYYPVFHITCITHRKNAIYPATIVGVPPQEDAYIAKATERIFLSPIKMTLVPEIVEMNIPPEGVAHNLTICSIKKTYPGQAIKAINSLWGAGQMMFNKTLIVVDADVDVHNTIAVVKAITDNVLPGIDTFNSFGPLDVLDHSSSRFSYGGKIGIDATRKLNEESCDNVPNNANWFCNSQKIVKISPNIGKINIDLVHSGISIVIVSVKKDKNYNIKKLINALSISDEINVKFIVLVDYEADVDNLRLITWLVANNYEPGRDTFVVENKNNKSRCMIIDGTRKTSFYEHFKRDWPNIVSSSSETIKTVDAKWESYGIDSYVNSPSSSLASLIVGESAFVEKNNK